MLKVESLVKIVQVLQVVLYNRPVFPGFEKPIFKKGLMLFEDLHPGMALSGRVTNVTTFGAFVDCGVGRDGLIYESQLKNRDDPLSAGDVVEVTVNSVDSKKGQFQLRLISVRPRLKAHLLTSSGFHAAPV